MTKTGSVISDYTSRYHLYVVIIAIDSFLEVQTTYILNPI